MCEVIIALGAFLIYTNGEFLVGLFSQDKDVDVYKRQMLNLVDGKSAVIEGDFEPFIVHYAETFIIPASIKEYSIKPYRCV